MAKNLILRAEDARLYNESVEKYAVQSAAHRQSRIHKLFLLLFSFFFCRGALIAIFNDIYKLNEDLISTYTIRQQNFIEMQKNLDAVNSILKSATRLRGNYTMWVVGSSSYFPPHLSVRAHMCANNQRSVFANTNSSKWLNIIFFMQLEKKRQR